MNNNNNTELLFWKVIHNKFLFYSIFKQLHGIDCNDGVENFENIRIENKKRFQDIQSLKWMITNKQYQLLKCKLNFKDEFIHIDESGIQELFSTKCDQEIKYEILLILLEKQYLDLQSFNLLEISITSSNYKVLELLINEPHSFEIYSSHLKLSISNDNHLIIDLLLNKLIEQQSKEPLQLPLKKNKLQCVESNLKSIEFIKSSCTVNQLFKFDCFDKILNQDVFFKLLKSLINNTDISDDGVSILVSFLKNIESITIYPKTSTIHQEILIILNGKDIGKDIEIITKELYSCLILNYSSTDLYNNYLLKYNDFQLGSGIGNGIINKVKYLYCIDNFNCLALESILREIGNTNIDCNYVQDINNDLKLFDNKSIQTKLSTIQFSEILKFIKMYISNQYIVNQYWNKRILILIHSMEQDQYEKLVMVLNEQSTFKLPIKNDKILIDFYRIDENIQHDNKFIIIKDQETIDWIVDENGGTMVNFLSKFSNFTYEKLELVLYAQDKFKSLDHDLIWPTVKQLLKYPYFKSIEHCNIVELEIIDRFVIGLNLVGDESIKYDEHDSLGYFGGIDYLPILLHGKSVNEIITLTNYLNNSGYICFDQYLFEFFIDAISNHSSNKFYNQVEPTINFKCFGTPSAKSISSLFESIAEFDPMKTQFILSSLNFTLSQDEISLYLDYWNENHHFENTLYTLRGITSVSNKSFKDLSLIIELVLKVNVSGNNNLELVPLFFNTNLNFIFNQIIKLENTTLHQIETIRNLILNHDSQFVFDHSLVHVFHYLKVASKKLLKYIMTRPKIYQITDSFYEYNLDEQYSNEYYDLAKYLDPNLFTFDYIFNQGTSFDQLLERLSISLSIEPVNQFISLDSNYKTKIINSELEYCLDIFRIDLFFNKLDKFITGDDQIQLMISIHLFSKIINNLEFNIIDKFIKYFGNDGIGGGSLKIEDSEKRIITTRIQIIHLLILNGFKLDFLYLFNENYYSAVKFLIENHLQSIEPFISFGISFMKGHIRICKLLLKSFPNITNEPDQVFNNFTISSTISRNKINIIKYFYKNSNIFNDIALLNHIQKEFSSKSDYKNLNFLK